MTVAVSDLVSQWWVSSDIFTKIDVLQKSPTVGTRISTYYPFGSCHKYHTITHSSCRRLQIFKPGGRGVPRSGKAAGFENREKSKGCLQAKQSLSDGLDILQILVEIYSRGLNFSKSQILKWNL